MDNQQIKNIVFETLSSIAPELEPSEINPDKMLRDQVDLDSMDFLNFIIALHKRLQVDIPEADYAKLTTLNEIVAYLKARLGQI